MIPAPLQNIIDRLTVAWHERAIALKAISFAFVGVVNTAIDFSIFWTAAQILLWPLVPANVLAWIVAVTFSYVMNSFTTFGHESGRVLRWRDYLTFVASGIAGMVMATATLFVLSYVTHLVVAKLVSIAVSFVINFSLSHFVVFRADRPRAETQATKAVTTGSPPMQHDDNLTAERPTFVTHLECSMTGERYAADEVHNLSKAGKPLLVRYDLDGVRKALTKEKLAARPADIWRYRELLPVRKAADIVSLGEVLTPMVAMPRLSAKLGGGEILVKDEGRLPTASFKARGLVMAVSMAKALGIKHMAMPTNGNAGAALAAYATRAGIRTTIFCPEDTPEVNVSEIAAQGASVYRVNGLIDDCGKIVGEGKAKVGWFDTSTLKEPYRIEGKKTMGLELAEQLGWELPDAIFYPTGGGTGLIGMWKAFAELEAIGFIGAKRPRMIAVQAAGCAPMVKAFEEGKEHAPRWENAHTIASGIRVPQAVGDFLILRAVRESGGFAIAVEDPAISRALDEMAREEGFLLCPEGAATYAAYKQALADGRVSKTDRVVLFNCASGLKYPLPKIERKLDRHQPIDYAAL
jgi:threonine synthase